MAQNKFSAANKRLVVKECVEGWKCVKYNLMDEFRRKRCSSLAPPCNRPFDRLAVSLDIEDKGCFAKVDLNSAHAVALLTPESEDDDGLWDYPERYIQPAR